MGWTALSLAILVAGARLAGAQDVTPREAAIYEALQRYEVFWRRISQQGPYDAMSARTLTSYALALSQVRQCPERFDWLFELTMRMQDRDPASSTYGNLRWRWRDTAVTDQNAVEFCVQNGLPVWLEHRESLRPASRQSLKSFLVCATEGCLRHHVPPSYTNIAILNAGNLIVLGETFARPDVAEEGYRRLEAICRWTWTFGVAEYCSPTYYGIDLDGLLFIRAYAQQEAARQQASALLELLWTDIALNWFAPADRLAGPQSRSYDYLRGLGYTSRHLAASGWAHDPSAGKGGPELDPFVRPPTSKWSPPAELRRQSELQFPRLVRQSWGVRLPESRTHMMYADVTLGCAGACYGMHDMPLTIDLPGTSSDARCYFIADGREDPYGLECYATSAAGLMKALHLEPFWAGAQRGADALGVVVYRPEDLASEVVTNVQSHLVLRRNVDGFWLRGRPVRIARGTPETPSRLPLAAGDSLVLRLGTAAVGIRPVWTRAQDGGPAPVALIDDGVKNALRLTVEHKSHNAVTEPGAAFWVRVGSGLKSQEEFDAWRKQFEEASPAVSETTDKRLRFAVPGDGGLVAVTAEAPFGQGGLVQFDPEPSRAVLELDGVDVGRDKLAAVDSFHALVLATTPQEPVLVPAMEGVYWEAEHGLVFPRMTIAADKRASDSHYIWQAPNSRRRATGHVLWPLEVAQAGRYYLWGRTLAPSVQSDSFLVTLIVDTEQPQGVWQLHTSSDWSWNRFCDANGKPLPLDLPAGRSWLQLRTHETGTKIDRLLLTPDPSMRPGEH